MWQNVLMNSDGSVLGQSLVLRHGAKTQDVSGDLAGLHDIMQLRNSATKPSTDDNASLAMPTQSINLDQAAGVAEPEYKILSGVKPEWILYAEVTGGSALFYMAEGETVYRYSDDLYDAEEKLDFLAETRRLLASTSLLTTSEGDRKLYLRDSSELSVGDEGIIYRNNYALAPSDMKLLPAIKALRQQTDGHRLKRLSEVMGRLTRKNAASVGKPNGDKEAKDKEADRKAEVKTVSDDIAKDKKDVTKKAVAGDTVAAEAKVTTASQASASQASINQERATIDKVLAVQQVVARVSNNHKLTLRDAAEVILVLHEASVELLTKLFSISKSEATATIDGLRRSLMLGEPRADGTYPILIKRLKDLIDESKRSKSERQHDFGKSVKTVEARGKKLIYDLDELDSVALADAYVDRLAQFVEVTRNKQLRELFKNADKEVKISQLLQVLSDDNDPVGPVADFELFHSYVTKFMIVTKYELSGKLSSYPAFQFNVPKTRNLQMDMLRYWAANLNWIASEYDAESLELWRQWLSELIAPTAQVLRHELVRQLDDIIERRRVDNIAVAVGQLTLDDAAKSTADKSNNVDSPAKLGSDGNN